MSRKPTLLNCPFCGSLTTSDVEVCPTCTTDIEAGPSNRTPTDFFVQSAVAEDLYEYQLRAYELTHRLVDAQ